MITIKKLSSEYWKAYRDLRLEALQNAPLAFGNSYEEEKKLTPREWRERIGNALFAVEKDQVAGMAVYVFHKQKKIKHIANIYSVYVRPEYRGQKIGDKLLQAAIEKIQKKGGKKITLHVNPLQKSALRLYKKYGFVHIGTQKKELFIDGKYYDELIMEKYL